MLRELWGDDEVEPPNDDLPQTQVLTGAEIASTPVPKQDSSFPVVPRHQLLGKLGEGGFAVVYRALQLAPVRRDVAVKVLRASVSNEQILARFEAERQTLARMEHPGIARLFDAGQTSEGEPFFGMELVRGVPITTWCRAKSRNLRDRLHLFVQICDAVQHAHGKGVLHRDLKPSNLLVDDEGRVKVIDFGIAKALEVLPDDAPSYTTSIHQTVGTPGYMSPEQTEWGAHLIDARSDVYALGVVLYELLAGRTPLDVERSTNQAARRRAVATAIKPPSRIDKTLLVHKTECRDLDAIVMKALERDPELRYPSADALRVEVQRHLEDKPVDAAQQSVTYLLSKFARRHRSVFLGSAVALLAIIVGLALSTVLFFREQKAHSMADTALEAVQARERDLQAREKDLRRALSRADFDAAQRFKREGDHQSAAASLARSLASDREFTEAAADLQTLLAYGSFPQPLAPPVPLKREWGEVTRGAVAADGSTIVAGFKGAKESQRFMLWQRAGEAWQERQIVLREKLSHVLLSGQGKLLAYAEGSRRLTMLALEEGVKPVPNVWTTPGPLITAATVDTRSSSVIVGLHDGSIWMLPLSPDQAPSKVCNVRYAITRIECGGADPSWIIAGCDNGSVHLWEHDDGTVKQVLKLPATISAITQSNNCRQIAAGDGQGYVAWRDEGNVEPPPAPQQMHKGMISALALGGHSTVVSAGADLLVRWHDMQTDSDRELPVEAAGRVDKIDVSRDEDEVTLVTADASVRLWRRDGGAPLTLRKPQRARYVATSVVGHCLVVQRDEGSALEVLSLASQGAVPMTLHPGGPPKRGSEHPRSLVFCDGDSLLSATDGMGHSWRWHLEEADVEPMQERSAAALAQSLSPTGTILSVLDDGTLIETSGAGVAKRLVEPEARDVLSPLAAMRRWHAGAVSSDGKGAVWGETASQPGSACLVRYYNRDTGKVDTYEASRLSCLAWNVDKHLIVEGLHNGVVRTVDVSTGRQRSFSWHLSRVTSIALSSDGTMILTGSTDGTIALWDAETGAPRSDYLRIGTAVLGVAFSGDGRRFALATERQFMVGDVTLCSLIGPAITINGYGEALALNHDGTSVAVAISGGATLVCKIAGQVNAPPPWFMDMTATFVSRRFTNAGVLATVEHPGLAAIQQALPHDATGPWNTFARWLLSEPGARTLSPWSTMTLGDYLRAVCSRPGEVATMQRRRYGPSLYSLGIDVEEFK